MKKISVCMATRNGEKYIKKQLDSILAQLTQEDEVVISDDSSSDSTIAIIKGFLDHRIRLYEGNAFFSPIFNLENALKHASGEIIVLSDQDDIWLDNKMSVIRREFSRVHSGIRLIVLDGHIVDEHEKIMHESIFARINSGQGLIKNIYDNTYMGCCMAFSRDLLKIALPFPRTIPMHDMWLGLLAELFGTVEFVREKTIEYRRHEASVTDLHRRLDVVKQIMRRYHLVTALLGRFLTVKYGRKSMQEKQI
jgi:glycosyltransferase involved in cell wall biosynthesis